MATGRGCVYACRSGINQAETAVGELSKKYTIYLAPEVSQALEERAASTQASISELIDEAARAMIAEDREDIAAYLACKDEETVSYEDARSDLKRHGKL